MFYLKTEVNGKMEKVEIYGDEIFTACFKCGEEMHIDDERILAIYQDGGDFSSTSIAHGDCVEKARLQVIDGGKKSSPSRFLAEAKANQ
ncbi:hypothetical protein [Paenibacillus sp. NPDC058177]|uniref:hypothetical protein n=1 Tax=Paenibacillus sp. NPDC058177 TaxID=3346369 RepID=UPI0036DD7553